ncbi:MAG: glycoside hydrolase [Armatimonadetes bacterium]|nr:glycoside hydrolase [Armatimonadota bacterium]
MRLAACLLGLCLCVPVFAQTRVQQTAEGWQVENAALRLSLYPERGAWSVLDKRCGYLWRQPAERSFPMRDVHPLPDGVRFESDLPLQDGRKSALTVTLRLPARADEIHVRMEAVGDDAPFTSIFSLPPLLLDTPQGALAVADYANGQLYPLHLKPFPALWRDLHRLDLPLIGVVDTEKGFGYVIIVETSDDAVMECRHYRVGEREIAAPQVIWWAQKSRFGYPRRLIYRFLDRGGYVAVAKTYRAYAKQQGLLVTLREKARRNPNLRKLFGAADVWGVWGVDYAQFVREAKLLGIDKLILHGTTSPEAMRQAVAAGYLTSEYDNYTDIQPAESEEKIDSYHDILPDSAVLKADGQRMTAWLTMEGVQFMKRCPALWVRTAQKVIPAALRQYPFLARFIDVTTAEALYECYDPEHPLTRTQKRECGEQLLAYVRSLGLVVGGEHGIWWGVPHLDYIEGMMSGGGYSWPAGHLIRPESKEQQFTDPWGRKLPPWSEYETWGIGHQYRIPLWELVFHDCVVSTWYWGDSSDWLLKAAPEVTDRKDLFNILYGTIPLLWLDPPGAWHVDRQRFLRTYRLTSKLHEAVATQEMLTHEFLTPNRAVQRTRFADGTVCVVNFGKEPYTLQANGVRVVLPEDGFWVKGPRIAQSRTLVGGQVVTTVRAEGYLFRETPTEWLFVRRIGEGMLRVEAFSRSGKVRLPLREIARGWDGRSLLVYAVSPEGERRVLLNYTRSGDGALELTVGTSWQSKQWIDVVWGKSARRPEVVLNLQVLTARPVQGKPLSLRMRVRNVGYAPARRVSLAIYADERQPSYRLWQGTLSLGARAERTLEVTLDTARLDGRRLLIAEANPDRDTREVALASSRTTTPVYVERDLSRWDFRQVVQIEAGTVDREEEIAVIPLQDALIAPESVRAFLLDEWGKPVQEIPAQCDRLEGRTEVVLLLPGKMEAGSVRQVALYGMRREGGVLPFRPPHPWSAQQPFIERETYRLQLRDGVPRQIAVKRPATSGQPPQEEPFISQLVFSSGKTGWVEEQATAPARVELLAHGALRTVVQVSRQLQGGVTYTKRYLFYPRFFDVEIETSTTEGTYSRAFYAQGGTYEDSGGVRATVDGKGEAEGVMGTTQQPRWYAVYTAQRAHACLALTPADFVVYWDGGAMGGIGFGFSQTRGVRLRYVFLPGASDASFAQTAYQRTQQPLRVDWLNR